MTPNNNLTENQNTVLSISDILPIFQKKAFEACFASCCVIIVTCLTLQGAGQKWYTTLSVLLDETVAKTRSTKPHENGEFLLQQTVSNFKGLIAGLGI
jgi:hypothetical protein